MWNTKISRVPVDTFACVHNIILVYSYRNRSDVADITVEYT